MDRRDARSLHFSYPNYHPEYGFSNDFEELGDGRRIPIWYLNHYEIVVVPGPTAVLHYPHLNDEGKKRPLGDIDWRVLHSGYKATVQEVVDIYLEARKIGGTFLRIGMNTTPYTFDPVNGYEPSDAR